MQSRGSGLNWSLFCDHLAFSFTHLSLSLSLSLTLSQSLLPFLPSISHLFYLTLPLPLSLCYNSIYFSVCVSDSIFLNVCLDLTILHLSLSLSHLFYLFYQFSLSHSVISVTTAFLSKFLSSQSF